MRTLLAVVAMLIAAPGQAAVTYTATFLQTPDQGGMNAFGLNNAGDVVGGAGVGDAYQAYLRTADGSYQALGGFGGTRSTANSITDNGIIAGQARTGATGFTSTPFIKRPGQALAPIPLPAGGGLALTSDVNDAGTVVGYYRDQRELAFRWSEAGGFESLSGSNGASANVQGINAAGVAVGGYTNTGGAEMAFRWNIDGSVTELERVAVPGDLDYSAAAYAINDAGQIAGRVFAIGRVEGECCVLNDMFVIWGADGKVARTAALGDFGTFAHGLNDINAKGDAIGSISYAVFDVVTQSFIDKSFAVLWRAGHDPVDLNDLFGNPEFHLSGALGLNDHGQIIAFGYKNNVRFDVLLTPTGAAVPEPATWAMMIGGLAVVGAGARRRRMASASA